VITVVLLGKLADLGMTPDQIAFMNSYPAAATALWALGVWGAFCGSVLVLLRSGRSPLSKLLDIQANPERVQSQRLFIANWLYVHPISPR
jgi:hypothetical protein